MSEAYKKFTAQDYSVVPFNAHKQYNFNSSSADDNQLKWYNVSWTSESISRYSSASSAYGSDTLETVKYNQIDHLFYKNFKNDTFNRFGYNNYLIHKRELYNRAQLLSIPAGLYGHEIKPGSFLLSSSNYQIVDDSHGNLIISGTIVENYPSDIRKNIFKLGPVKAFKAYDLDTIPGYAVKLYDPQNKEEGITKRFWRRGVANPNLTPHYTTPKESQSETDDSYYFNSFKYKKVTFNKNTLGNSNTYHSSIIFKSEKGSHIVAPHDSQYNFNEEDFSIGFYIKPEPLGHNIIPDSSSIGIPFGGGIIYHIDYQYAYIISTIPVSSHFPLGRTPWEWGPLNVNGGGGVLNVQSGPISTPAIGDGEQQTKNIIISDGGNTQYLGGVKNNYNINGYTDWYIPTLTEIFTADTNLEIFKSNGSVSSLFSDLNNHLFLNQGDRSTQLLTSTEAQNDINSFEKYIPGSNIGISTPKNFGGGDSSQTATTLPVRRVRIGRLGEWDNNSRYIICKSGTQTIIPDNVNSGTETPKNTSALGTLQSKDIISQPQFPFEIYMVSHSLYFDRSDGDTISSINCLITGSSTIPELHHVLCQKSASKQEIYVDGILQVSSLDTTIKQTQNLANLYIGSRGHLTSLDGSNKLSNIKFFNGSLSNINIWNESFNTSSIKNISESINASPYVGNIFYQNGFAVFTRPNIQNLRVPSSLKEPFNAGTAQLTERAILWDYRSPSILTAITSRPISFDIKDDGTKIYLLTGGLSADEKVISQLDMPDPYSLYNIGLNANTAGAGNSLIGTKAGTPSISSSFANISSSLKAYFNSADRIKLKYDGTSLFSIGHGYTTLSGSDIPAGVLKNSKRYLGGIAEYPLGTAWDISSGSNGNGTHTYVNPAGTTITAQGSINYEGAKLGELDYTSYHSDIDGYLAQQNMSATQLQTQYNIIDASSANYYVREGRLPRSFVWKDDGTRFYTSHTVVLERWFPGLGGNWRDFSGPLSDPFEAGNLKTTLKLEEWHVDTPFDVTTIKRTGLYVYKNTKANLGQVATTIVNGVSANNDGSGVNHYGKVGRSLDLSTIISPEGYPIHISAIQFNPPGTKMWLLTETTSTSEPQGTRLAAGGWEQSQLNAPNAPHWIPFTNNGTSREGCKMWEFDLTVPYNIESNVFVQAIPFGDADGVLENANPSNDGNIQPFGVNGNAGTIPADNLGGLRDFIWQPGGESFFAISTFGRTIVKIGTTINNTIDNPGGESPYKVHFQGSHLIYENEYQCTIDEHEFNDTLNISARKIKSQDSYELANFTTSSIFKPYITTVGLYNENNELLVVGKMGQPIMASDKTDTTIILRWDS